MFGRLITDTGSLLCLVPSQPLKVVFKEVTNSSVAVHWHQPTTPNGLVTGYRIYYMHDNFTDVETVRSTNPSMFYVLQGLSECRTLLSCRVCDSKMDF